MTWREDLYQMVMFKLANQTTTDGGDDSPPSKLGKPSRGAA